MNKLLYMLGIAGLIGFASCEKEEGPVINPDAETGTLKFQMNLPENHDQLFTLTEAENEKVITTFTCERPDYGFVSATSYSMQVSLDSLFTEDHFITLATTGKNEKIEVVSKELNRAIVELHELGEYPSLEEVQQVYFRMKAEISNATSDPMNPELTVKPAYSNVLSLNVLPYPMVLTPAEPGIYYIIGQGEGWDNSAAGVGSSLIPMNIIKDNKYDQKTGAGEFIYTGYFDASKGFKIIGTVGSYDEQWGSVDGSSTNLIHNDGNSKNIEVPADGFYTITLNSVTNKLKISAATVTPTQFADIELIGNFNDWQDDTTLKFTPYSEMNPYTWYATVTFKADGGCKFRAEGNWENSWGGAGFPIGAGPGGDISYKAGTYRVVFNQIDGGYLFFPL
ncbi:MAG: SusE domain-containing protein [Bacteroidales bacterium]